MPTYLIGTSSIERDGDLVFIDFGDFTVAIGVAHATLIGRKLIDITKEVPQ